MVPPNECGVASIQLYPQTKINGVPKGIRTHTGFGVYHPTEVGWPSWIQFEPTIFKKSSILRGLCRISGHHDGKQNGGSGDVYPALKMCLQHKPVSKSK